MTRLPAPMGLLIDRNRPLAFRFEGQTCHGYAGDTLASALLGEGRWLLSRSFKYHRPRGPLTLAGQDANTLVQLPDEPNVLADELPLREGLSATAQNVSGSLERDRDALLGTFSRFMPVGFYYRAFYKPKGMWKRWEPLIRRKAGLGVLDLTFVPTYHDKAYLFCDVTVIGAGPAGLSAALAAAQGGAEVLLIEQQPLLGGALAWGRFGLDAGQGEGLREELVVAVRAEPRIRVLEAAVCNGWFADHYLPVIQGNRMFKVRARQTILASGAFDQPVIFRNNDLPGILLTSAAQRLMRLYGVRPGQRAVVLAGNDDGYLAALDLQEQGVTVAALLDLRAAPRDAQLQQAVSARGIPVHLGHTVYEAHADAAGRQLARVDVRPIVGQGQVGPAGLTLDCDLLCMSAGYMPVYQLACQAGGTLGYVDEQAAFSLGNLPRGLHLAGSVNGRHALERVLSDGRAAASRALAELDLAPLTTEQTQADDSQVNFPWPMFAHPQGKEFVDFDEDLQIADIVNATRHGYRDVQLVKRFSTVGMGPSQGRHSALPTARLVAAATARSVSDTGVTTARPPFTAEKLAHVAGRAFDPYRRTAMHRRHLELGASLMPAGVWQRPAFYGPASERQRCIQAEVRQVREGVGLIDVSTLGGLDVRGPDAAELLERVYTFGFRKLPVGRTRYALMTAEDGVVIDDGVAARLGDEHFYVSATTSGVDRVYRSLLKWNAQWRLDVDIANVSAAFAAVNLAGPRSREVLRELCPELDLTPEAFPYLAVREGRVAGIPARLLRVGFVGELGYEIHVPARFGERLWDALMEAGARFGIRPFGVEAQRLLRLEKGHVIIGQDTDGMTHPAEIDMGWAIGRQKPFFVGQKSIEILESQPLRRKLVGFTLPATTTRPLEGHLVLRGDDIAGNVTSCEFSPTLGCIIGLAYAAADQAEPGMSLPIRVEGGEIVQATVARLPFYDPQSQRQEVDA